MAVAFDNTVGVDGVGVTTLTTGSFTISSGSNRAAILSIGTLGTITLITASLGGSAAAAITGASLEDAGNNMAARLWGVTAPPSGSKTATASWTTARTASLGVVTATNVDQTTSFNNGTSTATAPAPVSLPITSNAGDLTCSSAANDSGSQNGESTNQTMRYLSYCSLDTGPGTANPTHTWSFVSFLLVVGANFNQVALPIITQQPQTQRSVVGATATFNVTATGTGTVHYQWVKNGSNVGSDSSSYTTPAAVAGDDLSPVYCTVSDDNGSTDTIHVYWLIVPSASEWLYKA